MDLESLQQRCLSFPDTTEDIKWGSDLCFCIGAKMYLVVNPDTIPVPASFKVTDEEFEEVAGRFGFKPAPYLARYKWVHVNDISLLSASEWQHFAKQSYDLVRSKLPKKVLKGLSGD